jgi:hypothetical protein
MCKRGGCVRRKEKKGDLIEMFKITSLSNYINFVEPLRYFDSISRDHHNKRLHHEMVKTS